jgi:hypothetical protein
MSSLPSVQTHTLTPLARLATLFLQRKKGRDRRERGRRGGGGRRRRRRRSGKRGKRGRRRGHAVRFTPWEREITRRCVVDKHAGVL